MRTSFTGSPLEEPVYEAPPKRDVVPVIEELPLARRTIWNVFERLRKFLVLLTTVIANENGVVTGTG